MILFVSACAMYLCRLSVMVIVIQIPEVIIAVTGLTAIVLIAGEKVPQQECKK